MSTTFVARLVVREGQEARFESLQRELSQLTHATEPGTMVYDVIKHRTRSLQRTLCTGDSKMKQRSNCT